jgi:amidase
LKPTIGSVSRAGHILPPGGLVGRRTHVGPIARFVEDLGLAYSVIAGVDPDDLEVIAAPGPMEDSAKVDLASLRVAFFSDNGKVKANFEMVQAVRAVTEALRAAGLKCQEARPPGFESAGELTNALNRSDRGEYYEKLLQLYGTTKLHPGTSMILEQMRKGLPEGRDVLREWEALPEANKKFMEEFEIIVCPPCSNFAPTPQFAGLIDYSYASFFNLLGWPAAVVRVGRVAMGLPKGIQIVGRPWKEHEVLAVAALVEKKLGGWKRDFKEENLLGG